MSARATRLMSGWVLVLLVVCCPWAMAAEPAASPSQQEADKVLASIRAAIVKGPANVELRDQASVKLPENFAEGRHGSG